MNAPARLAAFAFAGAVALGAGAALGAAVGPLDSKESTPKDTAVTTTTMPAGMDMEHTGR